jgi:DNA polymerase-3 subunit gamma/tau
MAYTVLARRYRPQNFDEVIGQDAVVRTLRNAISADRVAHAYLFTGTRGVGKTTLARLLAKALNCEKGPTPDPCGQCDSCRRTQEGDDLDVIEIDGASNTGVDDVRSLRGNAIYAPSRSRFKIYIIDEVHMLSNSAFNALLKTLEEPPAHVKFIFATTDPQKVPATIHSRCQRFDFRSVPTQIIADHLAHVCKMEKIKADQDALHVIAREGRGSVRDALTILDQAITVTGGEVRLAAVLEALGLAGAERYFLVLDALQARDAAKALALFDAALNDGVEVGEFLDHLLDHFRSLLLVKLAGLEAPGLDATAEERARFQKQSAVFAGDQLTLALELVGEARYRLRGLPGARPLAELALVQLASLPDFVAIGEALKRLGPVSAGSPPAAVDEKKKPDALVSSAAPPHAVETAGETEILDPGPGEGLVSQPSQDGCATAGLAPPCRTSETAPPAAPLEKPMTSAEQDELRRDPKVLKILKLFDGRIVDMRRRQPS